MTNKTLNKFLILFIFTLTLIFSSNNTVNASDLCNPCQPGDGGKVRIAGREYADRPGEVAGYYYLTGEITMCHYFMQTINQNKKCWFIGDNNAILTRCQCVEPTTDTCQNPGQWSDFKYSYFTRIPEGGCNNGQQKYKKITYYTRQCLTCNCTGESSFNTVTYENLSCNVTPPPGSCSTSAPSDISKDSMNLTNTRTKENSYTKVDGKYVGYGSKKNPIDGLEILDRHAFTWSNGTNWGEGCPTNESNSLVIRILKSGKSVRNIERNLYFNSYNGSKSLNWILSDYIPVSYQCNKYYGDWYIVKKNGSSKTGKSASKALYFENMQPKITSVQTQRNGNIVYLSINAEGPYIKNIKILDRNNRTITDIAVKNKGKTVKTTSIDLAKINPNSIKVIAYNACNEESNVVNRNFTADIANIKFNIYKFNNTYERNINVANINCANPVSRVSSPTGRIRLGKIGRNIYGIRVTDSQPQLNVNKVVLTNNIPLVINEATVSESGNNCELRLACVNQTKVSTFRIRNPNITSYNLKFAKICLPGDTPPGDTPPGDITPPEDGIPTDEVNITFNIEKFDNLSDDFSCSEDSSSFNDIDGDIVISNESNYRKSSDSNNINGNKITISQVDRGAFPLNLSTNLGFDNNDSCRQVNLYCVDDKKLSEFSDEGIVLEEGETTLEYTLKFGESKKSSWITVFDGDVYSKNITEFDSCTNESTGSNFDRSLISKSDDDKKGNIYLEDNNNTIRNKNGDIIKDLSSNASSRDLWLNSFVLPSNSNGLENISNIDNLQGNKAYYFEGDLDIDNEINYFNSGVSVVYVNGDLSIDNNINSDNGFLTFIVNGTITIGNNFGIEDYLEQDNYTSDTTENLKVGLVALSEDGITFQGSSDEEKQDIPVIIKGFVLSKGRIVVNRDLGIYNADYPAVIINSYSEEFITEVTDIDGNFGFEIYDIQWEYAE